MIKIKNKIMDDSDLHNEILKNLPQPVPIFIKSCGGKLIDLEIDESKLNESEKTKLKEYVAHLGLPVE